VLHLLLAPGKAGPRLLPIEARSAAWATRGTLLLVSLLVVGWFMPEAMERLSGLRALPDAIRLATATLATALVLFGIARTGAAAKQRRRRRSRRLPPFPKTFFASAVVLAIYLLWLGGAGKLAFTLAVIIVYAGTESVLRPMVRFFWPGFGQAGAEFRVLPGLVLRVARLCVACIGFVAVMALGTCGHADVDE